MQPNNIQDESLNRSKALPNGAAATSTDAIDLQTGPRDQFLGNIEFEVSAPTLLVTPLPDTKTMIFKVEESADGSSWNNLYERLHTMTGAGGAGAAGFTKRFRVPSNVKRYIRVTATGSASGDASGSSFTVKTLF